MVLWSGKCVAEEKKKNGVILTAILLWRQQRDGGGHLGWLWIGLTPMDDMLYTSSTELFLILSININSNLKLVCRRQFNSCMDLSVNFVTLCKWFDRLKKDTPDGVVVPILTWIAVFVCWLKILDVLVWLLTFCMNFGVTPIVLEMGIAGCIILYVN